MSSMEDTIGITIDLIRRLAMPSPASIDMGLLLRAPIYLP